LVKRPPTKNTTKENAHSDPAHWAIRCSSRSVGKACRRYWELGRYINRGAPQLDSTVAELLRLSVIVGELSLCIAPRAVVMSLSARNNVVQRGDDVLKPRLVPAAARGRRQY
jgi:hypothetical protein